MHYFNRSFRRVSSAHFCAFSSARARARNRRIPSIRRTMYCPRARERMALCVNHPRPRWPTKNHCDFLGMEKGWAARRERRRRGDKNVTMELLRTERFLNVHARFAGSLDCSPLTSFPRDHFLSPMCDKRISIFGREQERKISVWPAISRLSCVEIFQDFLRNSADSD